MRLILDDPRARHQIADLLDLHPDDIKQITVELATPDDGQPDDKPVTPSNSSGV